MVMGLKHLNHALRAEPVCPDDWTPVKKFIDYRYQPPQKRSELSQAPADQIEEDRRLGDKLRRVLVADT